MQVPQQTGPYSYWTFCLLLFCKFHNSRNHVIIYCQLIFSSFTTARSIYIVIIGLIACYFCASFTTDKAIWVLHLLPVIFAQVSQQPKPYEFCTYCLLFLRKFHNRQSHMSFALVVHDNHMWTLTSWFYSKQKVYKYKMGYNEAVNFHNYWYTNLMKT